MPKIYFVRHQLAEQEARLRQGDKAGGENSNSPPLSSDEEKFEPQKEGQVQPVSDILQRPRPGLVIQPIPAPSSSNTPINGKIILFFKGLQVSNSSSKVHFSA